MSDQISNKLAGWAARARAAQVTLDLFSADRDKVARVAGQLLDLAQDVELAISAAPESDGDVARLARLDHVCVDGRNERCDPDHCAVAGCPVADRVETMRARLEHALGDVPVPADAIRQRLAAAGFRLIPATRGEEVYERRHDRNGRYAVKVYSSIQREQAEVRDCGQDAIRVVAVRYTGDLGVNWEWLHPEAARGIFKATRTFRTGSVDAVLDRMIERAREAYAAINAHRGGPARRTVG